VLQKTKDADVGRTEEKPLHLLWNVVYWYRRMCQSFICSVSHSLLIHISWYGATENCVFNL